MRQWSGERAFYSADPVRADACRDPRLANVWPGPELRGRQRDRSPERTFRRMPAALARIRNVRAFRSAVVPAPWCTGRSLLGSAIVRVCRSTRHRACKPGRSRDPLIHRVFRETTRTGVPGSRQQISTENRESWPRFLPGCPRGDPRFDVDYTSSARGKRATRPRYGVVRAAMRRNDLNSVHPRRCFRHLRCDQVPESCATFVLAAVESRFARAARRQQCGVSPSLVDQKRLASQTSRAAPPLSRDERRPLFHQVANRIGPVAGPCGPGNDEKASPRRSSGDGET